MTVVVRNRQRRHPLDLPAIRRFARQAAAVVGNTHADLSVVFVNDAAMARYNEQFHQTPGPTDILTFDYGDAGELIISVDHAHSQARRYRTKPGWELALYVVHGLLHLAGYDDRTAAQRRRMRAAERRVLQRAPANGLCAATNPAPACPRANPR